LSVGLQADNLLGNLNYLQLGSIARARTFGAPLAAAPGPAAHFSISFQ
jgi:hypothetical protein